MRRLACLSLLGALVAAGCRDEAAPAAAPVQIPAVAAPGPRALPANPEFDRKWSALAAKKVEALYIEDDRGQGLMGNVRRATSLEPPPPADPAPALPDLPLNEDVERVIRMNLGGVKSCYLLVARQGTPRSGKAIVSFEVGADGRATGLTVDAPVFHDTALPRCVSVQIARWEFPKSRKGGLAVSYPFVFVGG